MSVTWRLADGGLIDRTKPIRFRFDGQAMTGYAGDTLASALDAAAQAAGKLSRPLWITPQTSQSRTS